MTFTYWGTPQSFNPRSPCGERRDQQARHDGSTKFQSTLPVWGATVVQTGLPPDVTVSIHAPRVGSDGRG